MDCGLWVLAQIVAVLRGGEFTGLQEENMVEFRDYLRTLVIQIPITTV